MKLILSLCTFLVVSIATNAQTLLLESIQHDGLERDYRLYIPDVYDGSTSVPLVINLHGYTSNGFEQEVYGDFRPIADTANFILVHPEGTLDNSGTTFWNAFESPNETVDDVGFLSVLIDSIATEYNIDMNRVYSTGMSNGGFMSYKLACDLSYRIAAIASVTGAMMDPTFVPCNPAHPTPVMQIHGTADPTVPYLGSVGVLGVEAAIDYWVDYNNCSSTAIETAVPNVDPTDGCTADHFLYEDGDAGSSVELYRINGGGHTWPGSNPFIAIGVTNRDFSASSEIWRFFSQYQLDVLSTGINETELENSVRVYPNPTSESVFLQFDKPGKRTIQVRNSMGQTLEVFQVNTSQFELNLTAAGVYLLSITSEEGTFTKKLIRE